MSDKNEVFSKFLGKFEQHSIKIILKKKAAHNLEKIHCRHSKKK